MDRALPTLAVARADADQGAGLVVRHPGCETRTTRAQASRILLEGSRAVGEHLQDHLEMYAQYACKKPGSVYLARNW